MSCPDVQFIKILQETKFIRFLFGCLTAVLFRSRVMHEDKRLILLFDDMSVKCICWMID